MLQPMAFLSAYDPPPPPQAPWLQSVAALHPSIARALNRVARRVTRPWIAPIDHLRDDLGLPRGDNPLFEGEHSPRLVLALFSRVRRAAEASRIVRAEDGARTASDAIEAIWQGGSVDARP